VVCCGPIAHLYEMESLGVRALLTVLAYGSTIVNIGIHWGRTLAEFIRQPTALREHYVFARIC
jgi:hypothetical protein